MDSLIEVGVSDMQRIILKARDLRKQEYVTCYMLHIITVMLSEVYRKIPKSHSKGGTVALEDKYEKNFRFQG